MQHWTFCRNPENPSTFYEVLERPADFGFELVQKCKSCRSWKMLRSKNIARKKSTSIQPIKGPNKFAVWLGLESADLGSFSVPAANRGQPPNENMYVTSCVMPNESTATFSGWVWKQSTAASVGKDASYPTTTASQSLRTSSKPPWALASWCIHTSCCLDFGLPESVGNRRWTLNRINMLKMLYQPKHKGQKRDSSLVARE